MATKKNLFYSESENLLFWVAGYRDNSLNVDDIISMLKENKNEFLKMGAVGEIKTDIITNSRRYKHMRYFYCETKNPPKEAFSISNQNNWTMKKWLED